MNTRETCGLVMVGTVLLGGAVGFGLTFVVPVLAAVFCLVWTVVAFFVGMVLAAARHRLMEREKVKGEEEAVRKLHLGTVNLLRQQSICYEEVAKAVGHVVAQRIGSRVVDEVIHCAGNSEQREAAERQVGAVIEEELVKVNKEVWGRKTESCRKDDSGD